MQSTKLADQVGMSSTEVSEETQQQPLIAGQEIRKMKVMVAVDESDESFYALKWALDNLFRSAAAAAPDQPPANQDDQITVVHVQQPFQPYIYPAGPVVESVRKAQEETAAIILTRALQMCKERMIKTETLILEGDPKDMICQATEQMHVDLLVMGSRGLSKIKRAFLGSVSDYCAHHAKCPILIVKPPKESHK
ncbi:universal stress protein A-like protein isoform X2 [Cornus florida]|uniref:universal stress protein A-like protein isoform X2 n=1 Tax=Cornus florida TaxID=4283 RepID=UPI00289D7573|nr:universal stress protein A-like protein isoform X2 [Cornus florida]